MAYEYYEKYDMLKCFIQHNNNAATSNIFSPFARQKTKNIFAKLKQNLINFDWFKRPRPKKYNIEDWEKTPVNVISDVMPILLFQTEID